MRLLVHVAVFTASLTLVVTGVGMEFGWNLGFAAGAACWLLAPQVHG